MKKEESNYYISCIGKLCITIREKGRLPLLFKVTGTHGCPEHGTPRFTHKEIKPNYNI